MSMMWWHWLLTSHHCHHWFLVIVITCVIIVFAMLARKHCCCGLAIVSHHACLVWLMVVIFVVLLWMSSSLVVVVIFTVLARNRCHCRRDVGLLWHWPCALLSSWLGHACPTMHRVPLRLVVVALAWMVGHPSDCGGGCAIGSAAGSLQTKLKKIKGKTCQQAWRVEWKDIDMVERDGTGH